MLIARTMALLAREPGKHMKKAMLSAVDQADILEMTTEIVVAYVGGNTIPPDELPELIARIHTTLARLASKAPRDST